MVREITSLVFEETTQTLGHNFSQNLAKLMLDECEGCSKAIAKQRTQERSKQTTFEKKSLS